MALRFKGVPVPSAVLLKHRSMYVYSVPDSEDAHEHISGFVGSGYTLMNRQAVPPESAGFAASASNQGLGGFFGNLDSESAARLKWAVPLFIIVSQIISLSSAFARGLITVLNSGPNLEDCTLDLASPSKTSQQQTHKHKG